MANKKKIEWISILQGWSMLLVIIGHITLTNQFKDPAFPFSAFLEKIIYSFHMPLFMLVSGYLFHFSSQKRDVKELIVPEGVKK